MTGSLAKLPPTRMWKTKLVRDKLVYLAKEISKQIVEGTTWFFHVAFSKM